MKRTKSRSLRRVYRRTPGKRVVVHYSARKPVKPHCASCGTVLKGVLRERPYKMMSIPKTRKRPSRPFGGVLCSKCMRKKIKQGVGK